MIKLLLFVRLTVLDRHIVSLVRGASSELQQRLHNPSFIVSTARPSLREEAHLLHSCLPHSLKMERSLKYNFIFNFLNYVITKNLLDSGGVRVVWWTPPDSKTQIWPVSHQHIPEFESGISGGV